MWEEDSAAERTQIFENDCGVKIAADKMVVRNPKSRCLDSAEEIEKVNFNNSISPFQSLKEKIANNNKDTEIVKNLEQYFPNKLGIQELFEEVDEESTSLSDIPLQMLASSLRMDFEASKCEGE